MIAIMSEREYEMAGMRKVLEESSLLFVYKENNNSFDLKKNRFGRTANDLSSQKLLDLVKSCLKTENP